MEIFNCVVCLLGVICCIRLIYKGMERLEKQPREKKKNPYRYW